jgi:deoxyribonuclease-1
MCWQNEENVAACKNASGTVTKKNRDCCEKASPSGKLMIFDLYNLAPSAAQLNQYRSNDPYGEIPDGSGYEGFGDLCTARDLNSTTSGPEGLFEPPDCKKGDVARIWFYMRLAHGVVIDSATNALFLHWSAMDPVSPWERERCKRIADIQGNVNPCVEGIQPDEAGNCSWEQ